MKNHIKYIKRLGIFVLALLVFSCTEFEEYTSKNLGGGPTITLAQVSVQDSAFTVSVTSSADGSASVILLPGSGNTPPEDPEDLATGNVSAMEYQSKHVVANTASNFTFSGLVQDATYEVMAVTTNLDGKYSEVATLAVGTDDTYPPVVVDADPGVGYDAVLPVDGSVVLIFDEPVLYDDTKDLTWSLFFGGVEQLAGDVTVSGNTATVTLGTTIPNREYVMLSFPEGTFTDANGNLIAEQVSYFDPDAGALVGLFWRAETADFEATSITPAEAVVPAGFDIVVSFDEVVDADDVADGDITLTYDDGTDILIKSVLASEVSASGNDLTITQSYAAPPGVKVTLNIPADLLSIGYGNPNAEVTASWTILHPLQNWIGTYDVEAVSYAAPGDWDEEWVVTTAPVAGDVNSLAITIDAGYGGGVPFLAVFDTDAGNITITSGSDAGNIYEYGPTLIYVGTYPAIDMVSDIVGTIDADGTILIDQLAMYLPDFDYYWDSFNTTWTPSAKKSASGLRVNAAKMLRIK